MSSLTEKDVSVACLQTSHLPQEKLVPVYPECWGQPLIGCNVNAMMQIISGVNLRIHSPGKSSAFVDIHICLPVFVFPHSGIGIRS